MKVSDNWNSDGNNHYASVEVTYNLDVSYYLHLLYYGIMYVLVLVYISNCFVVYINTKELTTTCVHVVAI